MTEANTKPDAAECAEQDAAESLPVAQVAIIAERSEGPSWLIDRLWTDQAVGFIGGPPKSCKSWLGLDMAVSVASSTACLGRFEVVQPGPVLVYLAEDAHSQVRQRVAGLCRHRGLALDTLDVFVVTAEAVRLDLASDRRRLHRTLLEYRPRLLLLDPLVRLHRLDELCCAQHNSSYVTSSIMCRPVLRSLVPAHLRVLRVT